MMIDHEAARRSSRGLHPQYLEHEPVTLIAYHNDPAVKAEILAQLARHRAADELRQGLYWTNGKGCAVGCTIYSGDHMEYETRFGIPVMLARLEDCIFEWLPNEHAQAWPERFMGAIAPGADLSRVGGRFLHWLVTDAAVNPGIAHPLVRDAARQCAEAIAPLCQGLPVDRNAVDSAACAAESVAWSVRSALESAAESAAECAAWSAAWSARSAAWSAESTAWSVRSAMSAAESAAECAAESAMSAAWSADSAESAADLWHAEARCRRNAERRRANVRMADKLIELIAEVGAPPPTEQRQAVS
jgi:hypothetical protein